MISTNIAPSDMLNEKPCLLSLSGQTISLIWIDGWAGGRFVNVIFTVGFTTLSDELYLTSSRFPPGICSY